MAPHLPRMGLVVVVECVLALTGCTSDITPAPSVAGVPSERDDGSSTLKWGPCDDDPIVPAKSECAVLNVPLDHRDPMLGEIGLPLLRRQSQFPQRRIGTLIWVEGGPGGHGTDRILHQHFSLQVENGFDLVGWDPRGTSGSSRLDCTDDWTPKTDPLIALDPDPDTPDELAEFRSLVGEIAEKCIAEHGDLLSRVGTYESVLDLDLIRQALGEEQVSLIGEGYGSKVAAVYATLYPNRVRAMVLDGYDDPNDPPLHHLVERATALERRLDHILAACAEDAECPLGANGDPFRAFDGLFEQLEDRPLQTETAQDPPITQGMAYRVVERYLYTDDTAERMLEALQSAIDDDGNAIFRLYVESLEAEKAFGITLAVQQAIICADQAGYWDDVSGGDKAELRRQLDDLAPRLGWRFGPNRVDPDIFQGGMCEIQPLQRSRLPTPVDATDAGPIVVIGTTGDPFTPYEAAVRSIDDLDDANLVTVEADHGGTYFTAVHNVRTPKYRCLLDAVHAYLIDLEVPPADLVCAGG